MQSKIIEMTSPCYFDFNGLKLKCPVALYDEVSGDVKCYNTENTAPTFESLAKNCPLKNFEGQK